MQNEPVEFTDELEIPSDVEPMWTFTANACILAIIFWVIVLVQSVRGKQ